MLDPRWPRALTSCLLDPDRVTAFLDPLNLEGCRERASKLAVQYLDSWREGSLTFLLSVSSRSLSTSNFLVNPTDMTRLEAT